MSEGIIPKNKKETKMEIREFLTNCLTNCLEITQECKRCPNGYYPIVYVGDSGAIIVSSIQQGHESKNLNMAFGGCESEKEVQQQIQNAMINCY